MDVWPCTFGPRTVHQNRRSSTDWELPTGKADEFAQIVDTPEHFHAKIHLDKVPGYEPKEVDVAIYEHNIQVHAQKEEDSQRPNTPPLHLDRQYRLPEDTDLETLEMKRDEKKNEVDVDAEKGEIYGKNVKLHVVDVNPELHKMRYVN